MYSFVFKNTCNYHGVDVIEVTHLKKEHHKRVNLLQIAHFQIC